MKKLAALLFLATILGSCSYILDLNRTGDDKIIKLDWNGATNIEIWAPCQITLINIEHENTSSLQEKKMADIRLSAPDFETITYNAAGHLLNEDTLTVDQFKIVVNGKGIYTTSNLTLKGNSLTLYVYGGINKSEHKLSGIVNKASYTMEGGTDIDAINLKTQTTNINHKSYGNIYVDAEEYLNAQIYSTGNIYYTGQPTISFEIIENTIMDASGQLLLYSGK